MVNTPSTAKLSNINFSEHVVKIRTDEYVVCYYFSASGVTLDVTGALHEKKCKLQSEMVG